MVRGVKAGEAFVSILADATQLQKGLKRAQARLKAFGMGITNLGAQTVGVGAALTAPFIAAAKIFADVGDELDKMSSRTGLSAESLSRLGFAAEQSGQSLKVVEKGVRTMQRAVFDLSRGLSTQVIAFKELNLEYKDLQDLSPEEQFLKIGEALSQIEDKTKRAALSQITFGVAGQKLLTLFQDGAQGVIELQKQAEDLGIVIDTEQSKRAAEFTDQLNILRRVLQVGIINVGDAVSDVFFQISQRIIRATKAVTDFVKQNKELVKTILKVVLLITAIGGALVTLGIAIQGIAFAFGGLAGVIGLGITILLKLAATVAFLFTPLGILTALVVTLGVAVVKEFRLIEKATDKLAMTWMNLKQEFQDAFDAIVESIKMGNVEGALKVLTASITLLWQKMVAKVLTIWQDLKLGIDNFLADIATSILIGFTEAFDGAQKVALAFTNTILNGFQDLKAGFLKFVESVKGFADDITVQINAAFDPNQTDDITKSVIQQNRKASQERKDQIDANRDEAKKANDDVFSRATQNIDKTTDARIRSLLEGNAAIRQQQQEARDAAVEQAEADLQAAKDDLAKTVMQVRQENKTRRDDIAAARSGTRSDPFQQLQDFVKNLEIPDLGDVVQQRLSTAGSFTGIGIERGSNVLGTLKDSLVQQKNMAKDIHDIKRNQERGVGGVTFQ